MNQQIVRARDLGLPFPGTTGVLNAITDVPGLLVGCTTVVEEAIGICTGVTAVLPRGHQAELRPVWAGFHALNGNGEMTGTHWVEDAGLFYGPICLTNTHSVGIVHHAACQWMIRHYGEEFTHEHVWAMPVVAETYDGTLNDINGQHVTPAHVAAAIDGARSGPVAEGNVGGGTGMICYEFKGGTGTSSRCVQLGEATYTVGVLVQANHGIRDWLTILGVPVGRHLRDNRLFSRETGSIIVVIATDAPFLPHQLRRIAKRASIGIGRNGTPGGNNSGDIFLAVSTANDRTRHETQVLLQRMDYVADDYCDAFYLAAVEAIEESVVNALLAARDTATFKPKGRICKAIDHDLLKEVMSQSGVTK